MPAQEWQEVRRWLESPDAHWFLDDAVLGCLPAYSAGELLADYGLADSRENLRQLGRLVNEVLRDGH